MNIYNLANNLRDDDIKRMVAACNSQMRLHIAPAWDLLPTIMVFNSLKKMPAPNSGAFFAFINRDQVPDALGYHSENANGQQVGFIMTDPIFESGGTALHGATSVSATLSHEFAEWRLNPRVNVWTEAPDGYEYPQEASDAVQGNTYQHLGVTVSNFLLPPWFDMSPPAGVKFDYMGILKAPFSIAKDGYSMRREIGSTDVEQIGLRLDWKAEAVVLPRSEMRK